MWSRQLTALNSSAPNVDGWNDWKMERCSAGNSVVNTETWSGGWILTSYLFQYPWEGQAVTFSGIQLFYIIFPVPRSFWEINLHSFPTLMNILGWYVWGDWRRANCSWFMNSLLMNWNFIQICSGVISITGIWCLKKPQFTLNAWMHAIVSTY